jgi:hypothetical protein
MNKRGPSYLVELLLPRQTGNGEPVAMDGFEQLLAELTAKFGGVTSFVRAPGKGLWRSGGKVERDSIAVIEVMTAEIDPAYWAKLRERLEKELAQDEIVVRAHETRRL